MAIVEVALSPREAPPGGSVEVSITSAQEEADAASEAIAEITIGNGQPDGTVDLQAEEGQLTARYTLTAPQAGGDHSLLVTGNLDERCLTGAALLSVSPAAPCPAGQTLEVGSCVALQEGNPLRQINADVPGPGPGESNQGRDMVHPRSTVLLSDRRKVQCFMDSIAVTQLGEPMPDGLPEFILEDETPFVYCDHLAVDEERGLAVTSSRGTFGREGGLATFSLPDPKDPSATLPSYLSAVLDSSGTEGIVYRDGLIYAAGKPDRVLVYELASDGTMSLASELVIPEMSSIWAMVLGTEHLYVSSAGVGGGVPGELLVFGLSDPSHPALLGRMITEGPVKDIAPLGESVVAIAEGQAGVSLIDVSDASSPSRLSTFETPGSALSMATSEGYLLLADWDSLRLYDATDRGVLRFLGSSDFLPPRQGSRPRHGDPNQSWWGISATSDVTMMGLEFVVDEFVMSLHGEILPGHRGARFKLPTPHIVFPVAQAGESLVRSIKLRSDGTEPVLVEANLAFDLQQPLPSGQVSQIAPILVPPMGSTSLSLSIDVPVSGDPLTYLRFDSNDLENPIQGVELELAEDNYAIGDPQPVFALPIFNECGPEGCSTETRCFDTSNPDEIGNRPIVLAFFSTW